MIYSNSQCLSNVLTVFNFTGSLFVFLASIISLIVVFRGLKVINKFEMKNFDATYNFYAKLESNLKLLLKRISLRKKIDISNAETSAFIHFCMRKFFFINEAIDRKKEYFNEERLELLKKCAENTMDVFNTSDGQIPLSVDMIKNIKSLHATLLEIIDIDSTVLKISDLEIVVEEHEKFVDNITSIIKEINQTSNNILEFYWAGLKKTRKNKKNLSVQSQIIVDQLEKTAKRSEDGA